MQAFGQIKFPGRAAKLARKLHMQKPCQKYAVAKRQQVAKIQHCRIRVVSCETNFVEREYGR